jgi:dolichol-phosphate mannosyltransferase
MIPALSIIVPTYNERDRLGELVAAVLEACASEEVAAEVVVVDDHSPDGTGELADALARVHPVRVVHRAGKLGLGSAVIDGFHVAAAPIVGVIDADMSHPPALLPRMLAVMQQADADFVIGSRYVPGGGSHNWSVVRLALSRLACLLAMPLTPVRDATSGVFLIRGELARDVRIAAGGFKICLELLIRSRPRRVIEVPYVFEGRTAGESKMNAAEALGYLLQLRNLRRFRRDHRAPPPDYTALTPAERDCAVPRRTSSDGAQRSG